MVRLGLPAATAHADLFRALGGVPEAVCLAYAEAEREGKVPRPCGAEFMTPGAHAHLLLQEGKLKGWLRR